MTFNSRHLLNVYLEDSMRFWSTEGKHEWNRSWKNGKRKRDVEWRLDDLVPIASTRIKMLLEMCVWINVWICEKSVCLWVPRNHIRYLRNNNTYVLMTLKGCISSTWFSKVHLFHDRKHTTKAYSRTQSYTHCFIVGIKVYLQMFATLREMFVKEVIPRRIPWTGLS